VYSISRSRTRGQSSSKVSGGFVGVVEDPTFERYVVSPTTMVALPRVTSVRSDERRDPLDDVDVDFDPPGEAGRSRSGVRIFDMRKGTRSGETIGVRGESLKQAYAQSSTLSR